MNVKESIQTLRDNDRELIDEIIQLNLTRIDKKIGDIESMLSTKSPRTNGHHHNRIQSSSSNAVISANNTGINVNGMKYATSEYVNKMFNEIVDELEKKLTIINHSIKDQFKVMDVNLVDIIGQKNDEFDKLSKIVKIIENNMIEIMKKMQNLPNNNENIEIKIEEIIKQSLKSNNQ